jgi:protein ImuB
VELPDEMLLEVKSSLKLFGGLAAIEGRLMEEFRRRCIAARLSAAPTPLAALWLARNGGGDVERPEKVAGCLSALDLSISRWPDEIQSTLRAMGLRTMGDCLRLPREGFARRIGRQYLLELDKALGRAWDQREVFVPARRLSATVELLCEVTNTAALAKAGKQLADRLSRALLARQAQVQGLEMTFHHLHREPTKAQIDLVEPAHDAERIFRLLEDKLERIVLPAPAVCIGLRTAPMQPMRLRNEALPLRGAHARLDCAGNKELVERLRGRLGTEQVYGLALLAEHRPEAAWRKVTEGLFRTAFDGALMAPCASQRPLWLLPEPLPLKGGTGQPSYRGRLWLESGP